MLWHGRPVDRRWRDLQMVGAYIAYRIGTYTCMPYECNWSQDV